MLCVACNNPLRALLLFISAAGLIDRYYLVWLAVFAVSMSFMDHRRDGRTPASGADSAKSAAATLGPTPMAGGAEAVSREALQAEGDLLRARVKELTLEREQLKRESFTQDAVRRALSAGTADEEPAATPALQSLRDQTMAVLSQLEGA